MLRSGDSKFLFTVRARPYENVGNLKNPALRVDPVQFSWKMDENSGRSRQQRGPFLGRLSLGIGA